MSDIIEIGSPGDWFDLVYARCSTGWLSLFSVEKATGARHVDWAPVAERSMLADAAESRAATCDVWFGVATRKERLGGKRGGSADCLELPALYADFDVVGPNHKVNDQLPKTIDQAKELLGDFPVAATALVYSGGGIQPYWILEAPVGADEAERILTRWGHTWATLAGKRGLHVDDVFDLARVLRVPGTFNRKNTPVKVVARARDEHVQVGAVNAHLTDSPAPPPRGESNGSYSGATRPGDAFNDTHRGGDVLALRGFLPGRDDRGGDQHWRWPEAASDTSATVYGDDGHTTIWSETVARTYPAVQTMRPYDCFGLYCVLFCDGDWSRATQELADQGYGQRYVFDLGWLRARSNSSAGAEKQNPWRPARSVAAEKVEWLWYPRIPLGKLTLIAGDPGVGKGFVTAATVASATSLTPIPDGGQLPTGTVLWASFEDAAADTLRPRLENQGADLDRVLFLDQWRDEKGRLRPMRPFDVPALDELLEDVPDAHLLVIDPVGSFIGGGVDSYRDNEVRGVLQPLVDLAVHRRVAVLVVAHLNKAELLKAIYRIAGSIGFVGIARSVLAVGKDEESGRRGIAHGKTNLGPEAVTIEYRIVPGARWDDVATLEWVGVAQDLSKEMLLGSAPKTPGPDPEDREACKAAIFTLLADGEKPADYCIEFLKATLMVSDSTIKRARKEVGVIAEQVTGASDRRGSKGWTWRLP